jgi:uncharacterized membrane protein
MPARPSRHPLHPPFIHFPIAFWISAVLLDLLLSAELLAAIPGVQGFALPHLLVWAGIAMALPAVTAGLFDYAKLPSSIQSSQALKGHMLSMASAFVLFLGSAIWRVKSGAFAAEPAIGIVVLELLGAIALVIGGYMASQVVFVLLQDASSGDSEAPL